ncbi:MAG TPA: metallophosphoesterase, partial [Acidimicrobiia bacterium]|nr:metallophosphoesterase [Acidimicrobiia bacterium]
MNTPRKLPALGCVSVLVTICLVSAVLRAAPSRAITVTPADPQAVSGSITFGAAGDMGGGSDASATLTTLAAAGTNFFLHLGDMSYGQITPESAWCKFVTDRVGTTFPYEIVSGGHESNTNNGDISKFAACLPDKVGGINGKYGKQYFFDYPQAPQSPLARIIMISPGEKLPEGLQSYVKGTANYAFVQNSIENAHAAGIPWVIVGMAFDCITAGEKSCEISADLFNLLVSEKVDLVLQGHEHGYERSKQLALSGACPAVPVGSFKSGCVVDDGSDNAYSQGLGPVV